MREVARVETRMQMLSNRWAIASSVKLAGVTGIGGGGCGLPGEGGPRE